MEQKRLFHRSKFALSEQVSLEKFMLPQLPGWPDSELVALVDLNEDSLNSTGYGLPDVSTFTNLEQAISKSGAEAWIVASLPDSHVTAAKALLAASGECDLALAQLQTDETPPSGEGG